MKYTTKKVVMDIAYLLGISVTTFALGWMWGNYDTIEGIKEGLKDSNAEVDEKPDHGRFEWADGGAKAYEAALEEADKEEENESES